MSNLAVERCLLAQPQPGAKAAEVAQAQVEGVGLAVRLRRGEEEGLEKISAELELAPTAAVPPRAGTRGKAGAV